MELDYKIVGAWPKPTETDQVTSKEILTIEPGVEITPQFRFVDNETGEAGYLDGDPFVLEGELVFDYEPLGAGDYLFGLEVTSINREVTFSHFVVLGIYPEDEEEWYAEDDEDWYDDEDAWYDDDGSWYDDDESY